MGGREGPVDGPCGLVTTQSPCVVGDPAPLFLNHKQSGGPANKFERASDTGSTSPTPRTGRKRQRRLKEMVMQECYGRPFNTNDYFYLQTIGIIPPEAWNDAFLLLLK